jgi:hypothetical protein
MRIVIDDDAAAASHRLTVLLRRWSFDPTIVSEDWHSQQQLLHAPAPASDPYQCKPADAGTLQTSPGQGQALAPLREVLPGTR